MKYKAQKNKLLSSDRRTLIGLTGAALVASQLPSEWTKPLINSVILPAHAQTSVQASIVLEGFSRSLGFCEGSSGNLPSPDGDSFSINDADVTAPFFVPGADISIETLDELNSIFFFVDVGNANIPDLIISSDNQDDLCAGPHSARGGGSFSARVTGIVNGTNYNATGTLSANGVTGTLSDIIFTPV